jgi:hypothetical protein
MVYFKFQWGNEIRRLDLGRKSFLSVTYPQVKELALSLFGSSLPKRFALKYKDEENDLVTISSERELREALNLVDDDGVLKFVITEVSRDFGEFLDDLVSKITSPEPLFDGIFKSKIDQEKKGAMLQDSSISEQSGVLHPAICDYCGKQIQGIRWKCGVCPDFDLCCVCEEKPRTQIHQESHYFIKLVRPEMFAVTPIFEEEKKHKKPKSKKVKKSKKKAAKKEPATEPVELPKVENEIALFRKKVDKKTKLVGSLIKSISAPASPISAPRFEQPLWMSQHAARSKLRVPEVPVVSEAPVEVPIEESVIEEQIEEQVEPEIVLHEEVVEVPQIEEVVTESAIQEKFSEQETSVSIPLVPLEELDQANFEEAQPLVSQQEYSPLASQLTSSTESSQVGASQIDASQVDASQIGASQVDASQIDASQVDSSQIGASQVTESVLSSSEITDSQISAAFSQMSASQEIDVNHPIFELKLKQLADMGFNDRVKNIQFLMKQNGDMLETVKSLLDS